jgi:hypothetical protein
MNRRIVLAGVALTAGFGLAGVSLAAQAGTPVLDGPAVVGELGEARVAADALPASLPVADVGAGGLVSSSARLLGSDETRTFWVARDAAGDLCLVVSLDDATQLVATACGRPAGVQRHRLVHGFQAGGSDSVANQLPAAARHSGIRAPWSVVGDNIVVADTAAVGASGTAVPLEGGGTIPLTR